MNAYEFLFFSDNLIPSPDKLTALDVLRKSLALGTNSSCIYLFTFELIEVGTSVEFSIGPVQQKSLGLKKPIVQLEICDNKKLVVLCDNLLQVLSIPSLEVSYNATKLKNVTSFQVHNALYEKSLELYIGTKKKTIVLLQLGDSKPQLIREISLPEVPLSFRVDGDALCVGLWSRYLLVNCAPDGTQQQQELFSLDDGQRVTPLVELVEKGEFLVTGMNNLGIFVSAKDGSSRRPPLQLDSNTLALACASPYVLSLNDEFLTVHSGLHYERQQVQTHSVNGGLSLALAREFARCGSLSHIVLIACQSGDLQAALPLPWYSQVEQMLREGQVDEAMRVAEHARQSASDAGQSSPELLAKFRRIQQAAGLACLRRATSAAAKSAGQSVAEDAQKATQYLVEGRIDLRHLLGLCPGLLPPSGSVELPAPPDGLSQLAELCRAEPDRMNLLKAFLLELLFKYRVSRFTGDLRREADTALLKLCSELRPGQTETLIYSELDCDSADCLAFLASSGRHHARALLLRSLGRSAEACQVWRQLLDDSEAGDPQFPGVDYFAEYVTTLAAADADGLFWPHAEYLLAKEPERHLRVLTGCGLPPSDIVTRLESRAPKALLLYLEQHLLLLLDETDREEDRKLDGGDERLHTRLGALYLDAIEEAGVDSDSDAAASLRARLLTFLRRSKVYRAQFLLGRLQTLQSRSGDSGASLLLPHLAELRARCGDIDGALRVLLLDLGDCDAAAELCSAQSNPGPYWSALLAICLSGEHRDRLLGSAVRLLNRPDVPADGARVLPLLPANYPVGPLRPFLCSALRRALHRRRSACLAKGLAVAAQLTLSHQLASLPNCRSSISLTETTRCAVCNRRFDESSPSPSVPSTSAGAAPAALAFVLTSTGQPAHFRCCPWLHEATAANSNSTSSSAGSPTEAAKTSA
ncbi:hypothetical protein BOX15_Mlig014520g1 [Macrostomum lignano]|uniref:CNH domain-containing protein n=3 Tax=Macrostomum lignano TaxID=282301 RepID=A0A267H985_9PLAT|nr:hypothetical protein BOX15_Mlig014520g1 [Macrostomum lignano]